MARESRITPAGEKPAPPADRVAKFDAVARWLLLVAFGAFAIATGMNLRLIQRQLDLLDERIEDQRQTTVERDFWRLTRQGTNPEQRTDSFLRLVAAGNTEWRTTMLKDMNLDDALLNGVSLQFAVFDSCSLEKSSMRGADLSGGGFETCEMKGTDLQQARLLGGRFFRCTMNKVNLRGAKLVKSSFEQSTLKDVQFFGAEMAEADLLLAVFEDCDLSGVDLTSAKLSQAKFRRTNLRLARLPDAILVNTDFTDSNWWRARGLPTRMIDEYRVKFPPSKNAPKEFREDWDLWLKTGGS